MNMRKFLHFFLLIIISVIIMCSCSQSNTTSVYRAVTQVDIVTEYKGSLLRWHYDTPEKIQPVLLHLRLLKPTGKPVQIDDVSSDIYLISISLSDGQQHFYRQASHKYLSKQNGPFKTIEPQQAAHLYRILQELPSDI